MKKIEAIIKPYVLEDVKAGLQEIGLMGMTVSEVRGYTGGAPGNGKAQRYGLNGYQPGAADVIQGGAVMYSEEGGAMTFEVGISTYGFSPRDDFVPSLKIELVVGEPMVDEAINVIVESGQLRSFSAGELVVYHLVDVIRIRTEEHLEQAI